MIRGLWAFVFNLTSSTNPGQSRITTSFPRSNDGRGQRTPHQLSYPKPSLQLHACFRIYCSEVLVTLGKHHFSFGHVLRTLSGVSALSAPQHILSAHAQLIGAYLCPFREAALVGKERMTGV